MQIISFINMKGGVGKTTLAVNVAYGLAYFHDQKVLVVDVDPQFNATQCLMKTDAYLAHIRDPKKGTLQDIFIPNRPSAEIAVEGVQWRAIAPVAILACALWKELHCAVVTRFEDGSKLAEGDQARGLHPKLVGYAGI